MTEEKITRLRIQVESYDYELLMASTNKVADLISTTSSKNCIVKKLTTFTLPTSKRSYCVLRSPHVDKDSREHFEIRLYKRVIDFHYNSDINIFDLLAESNLSAGVLYHVAIP